MKTPKYFKKVDFDTKPTKYDPIGCDGLYLVRKIQIKRWGWFFIVGNRIARFFWGYHMEDEIKEGELCFLCRERYLIVWQAPDRLWKEITGFNYGGGLLCPLCFDKLARKRKVQLYWSCREGGFGDEDKRPIQKD